MKTRAALAIFLLASFIVACMLADALAAKRQPASKPKIVLSVSPDRGETWYQFAVLTNAECRMKFEAVK